MGGGGQSAEQPGRPEHQRAGADRGGEPGALVGITHPVEDAPVVEELAGAHASGYDHDIGFGELLEGGVDGEAQQPVLGPHLTLPVADEGDVEGGDALEHLVGSDGIQRGHPFEQGDDHLQSVHHADLLSGPPVRKRRR